MKTIATFLIFITRLIFSNCVGTACDQELAKVSQNSNVSYTTDYAVGTSNLSLENWSYQDRQEIIIYTDIN